MTTCLVAGALFSAPLSASADDADDAVASGVLRGSDGIALSGVPVTLVAKPTAAQLDALAPGQTLPVPVVDTATTDSQGRFTLGAQDVDALDSQENAASNVNFRVFVPGAPTPVGLSFTGTVDDEDNSVSRARAGGQEGSPDPEAVALTYPSPASSAKAQLQASRSKMKPMADVKPSSCLLRLDKDLGKRATSLARYYSRSSGVSARYALTSSATMTFGVGVSAKPESGFKASGTAKIERSAGVTEDTPALTGSFNNAANADVEVKRFSFYCGGPITYEVDATDYKSSLRNAALSSAPAFPTSDDYCIHKQKGAHWAMDRSTASTIGGGLDVSGLIGIDLSAQSGFTTNETLHMDFPNAAGRVCGQKSDPLASPGMLVARNAL